MTVKRLSETGVERITPPASGRDDYSDEIVKGLHLRVTSSGVKSWYHVYRFGGNQRRMFLGRYPDIQLLKARTIVRSAKEQLALGNDPFSIRHEKIIQQLRKQEEGITVEQLAKNCLERHWKVNNRTWKGTEQLLENHVFPYLGNMIAKEVRRKDIIARIDALVASDRPSAANHVLVAVRKMYNWGIERDIVEFNPCHNIKKPVKIQERERVLKREEIKILWRVCSELGYPYGPLIKLLLLTGQRRSEIANLKWSHIDFNKRVINLPPENVKANRGHEVPLSDMAITLFQSLPRFDGPYIFTTTFGKKPVSCFSKAKATLDQKMSVDDWRLHDLRRTCGTGIAELGVSMPTISRILNHSEGGVTRIYVRSTFLSEKQKALSLWAQHISEIIEGDGGNGANIIKMRRTI